MTRRANHRIAEDFLDAYKDRDFERIKQLLHDDIEWTLPGNGTISGVAAGTDAVINRIKAIIEGGIKTELHHILVGQFGIALSLHNTATREDGQMLDEELATVLTIESGLIKKIDTYLSDVPMVEKYFQ
jgi:hypothetical protein